MLLVAACSGKGESAPSGQVVAVVGGQELTVSQLNTEMQALGDAGAQANLREAALRTLVERELLAQAAEREGVGQLPDTAIQLERLRKTGMVEALAAQIRRQVPQPSDDEVRQAIAASPASYANRSLLIVDQLLAPVTDPDVLAAMAPLETLEEIVALLDQQETGYGQRVTLVDPLDLTGEQAELVGAMSPGEVFILPEAGGLRINRIRQAIPSPVTGEDAVKAARRKIIADRTGQIVANRLADIIRSSADAVAYNPQFAPNRAGTEG